MPKVFKSDDVAGALIHMRRWHFPFLFCLMVMKTRKQSSATAGGGLNSTCVNRSVGIMAVVIALLMLCVIPCRSQDLNTELLPTLPNAFGVAGPFAGISGGALLVCGGANFPNGYPWEGGVKVWHEEGYVLSRNATNWLASFKLPHPLAYGVSFTDALGLICVGGSDARRHYDTVYRLTWVHDRVIVTQLNSLPEPCANACGAMVGNLAVMAGGESMPNSVTAMSNVWAADLSRLNPIWRRMPTWPGPARSLAIAASCGGDFFLVGGVALAKGSDGKPVRTYLKDAYAFNVARQTWRQIADLPHPMAASPSPAIPNGANRFSIMGGDDGSRYGFQPVQAHPGFCSDVFTYDTTDNSWHFAGNIVAPRATVPAVGWNGKTIIPSGEVRPGVRSPEVRSYWFPPVTKNMKAP